MDNKIRFLNKILSILTSNSSSPKLPEVIFLVGTYFFPQVNVEVIVRNNENEILYLWRDDLFGNRGWHLPGGIVRPNESLLDRVYEVLISECNLFGLSEYDQNVYLGLSEVIQEKKPAIRSHFVSHLFLVDTTVSPVKPESSLFKISKAIPDELIFSHKRYEDLLYKLSNGIIPLPSIY